MLGELKTVGAGLEFHPRFPLEPGLRYRAELRSDPPLLAHFELPRAPAGPAPRVLELHPSSPRVPENLLKLYVQFSAPMSQGVAYRHLELLDAAGAPVRGAIVELEPELWDPSGTRLTLLFDPGRIKRELAPNRELGPPLRAGARYTLRVDSAWPDPRGTPLAAELRHAFEVTEADREPPDPTRWQLELPAPGTRTPLRIVFGEALDHALLQHALRIQRPDGPTLPGAATPITEDRGWQFTPATPWQAGEYRLQIDPSLEDLAGNRPGRPFDVDTTQPLPSTALTLPFTVH